MRVFVIGDDKKADRAGAVFEGVMGYLIHKYFVRPAEEASARLRAKGCSAEAWYEAGGDFYEAEARQEAQALGYTLLPDGTYHPHRRR
ncbi:hypothetical protein D6833_13870 [Candidatus Parcubacteria bacterium]|nr:MAG: hypothetical protein D6833_13870 [Candidatus Parcubacteria bacterium]